MRIQVYLSSFLRLLIAVSLIASMFPRPVWASSTQPATLKQTADFAGPAADEVEILTESLDPLLPASLAAAVTEFTPNGFLINSDLTATSSAGAVDWVDNPLTVGRVQSAYRAADAIDATLVITVTVHNNRPPSSFVQLPAGATITDTLALFADVDLTDDPNTVRNVILTNQLAGGITLLAATPLPDSRDSEYVWNLGDIPPLGQAEVVLQLEIPGAVTDFISLDTGAAAWGTLQGRGVSGQAWPAALAPDMLEGEPLDRWLKRTLDADTHDPYLLAQAARLGQDPARMFAYVRSLGYEAYTGSLRGTRGTLWSEAGNAVDQSSLLIALLRSSGIPTRYAHGTLSQTRTEELILSMFPTPTRYIGHIPAELDVSEPTADPQILAEAGDHWWVQAYLNGQWLDLDPSFPQAAPGEVFADTLLETMDELPDALRHRVTVQVEVETYNMFLFGLQRTIQLDHTFRSVELAGNPVTLGHLVDTDVQAGLISYYEQRTYIPYLLLDDEIVEGTPFDEIMSSIFGALINRIVTAEWLLFTLQHPDGSSQTYRREIADLIGFENRQTGGSIQFEFESGSTPSFLNEQSSYTSLVGAATVPESVIPAFYPQVVAAMADMHEANEAAQAALNSDAPESEKLAHLRQAQLAFSQVARLSQQMHLLTFAAASDFGSQQLGNAFLVKPYFDTPRILITSWEWDEANDVRRVYFDLHRDDIRTVAYPGQAWEGLMAFNYARGLQEIALESTLLEEMAAESATSVHAVFREAKLAGIPLVALTAVDREELARLEISAEAKARISETLQEEQNTVIVPAQMVTINGQTTVGWIVIDEVNGRTVDMMENGQRLAAIEYGFILASDWHKLNFAFIGFMQGFAAYSLAFVGSLLGNLNSGASIKDIWAKSLEEATALVDDIVKTIDAGAHFLGNCTFIPGNPTNDWVKAYLHGTGYGVNITIGFKLKLGFAGDVAKCLGIPTGHSETIYEKTITGGGFINGATAADMYMRSQVDPPLPALLMARWPGEAPGLAQVTQTVPVAATLSGSQVNAVVDTELLAATGTLDFNWSQSDTWSNGLAFTSLTAAAASLYDEGGTLLGSGLLEAWPQSDATAATALVSGAEVGLAATGTAAFYAPALTGLAAGSDWANYTAQLTAAAPYTIELVEALVSLDGMAVYSGRLTAVVTGSSEVSGDSLTAVPNFAPNMNATTNLANLIVAPVGGSVTVGGQAVPANNGFALADYAGSLTLSELDPAADRATLDGNALFFTLNLAPATSTTAATNPVAFQATIPANFNDSYTMTVTGPVGWQIDVDAGGTVSAGPPLGSAAGDYSLQVVAQSHTYPGLFVAAEHTVTVMDSEGVALAVHNDPFITVPWGPAADNAVPGSTNSGQLQLTGAAFTIDITNTSSIAHTFDLSVSGLAADWVILSGAAGQTAATISLPAGGVGQLGLYISPTLSLPAAGTPYAFNVTATAVANPALSQSASDTFIVPAIAFSHMVVAPDIVYAAPDSTASFDLALSNVGNVAGDFALNLLLPDATWTELSTLQNPVTVAAGATVTQVVTLSLPEAATLGRTYQVLIESPVPDIEEYVQKAVVAVIAVSPQTEALYELAADMEELFPDNVSLPAALQALGLAVTDLEASCATTCALDLRDRVVAALISLADQVEALAPQGETAATLRQIATDMATATEAAELLAGTAAIGEAIVTLQVELEAVAQHNLQAWLTPGLVAILDDGSAPAEYTLRLTNHGRLETTAVMTLTAPTNASSAWTNMTAILQPGELLTIPISISSTVRGLESLQVDITAAESSLISRQVRASLNVVDAFVRVTQVIAEPAFVETGTSSTDLSVEIANVANVYRPAVAHTSILTPDGSLIWSEATPVEVRTGAPRLHALGTVDTSGWAAGIYTVTVELVDGDGNFIPDGRGVGFLAAGQVIEAHHAVIPALVVPGNVTVTTVITTQMRPDLPQPSGSSTNHSLTLNQDDPDIAGDSAEIMEETAVARPTVALNEAGHDTAAATELTAVTLTAASSTQETSSNVLLEEGETGIIRYEEDDPALIYEPEWTRASYNWVSGGFSSYHDVSGSSVSLTFEGTWLGLGFATRTNSGLAEIFIDDVSRGIVDTYSRFDSTISVYYDDLTPGSHTVTIVVLGDRNPNSTANFVRLDYIDVWDGSAMVEGTFEQDSDRVHLSPNWTTVSNALAGGGSFIRSGSSAWFPFTGDSVTFQAFAYSSGGQIEIFIDGQWQGRFDLYNASNALRTFSFAGLGAGPHVLQVRAYRSNATVDAFITPGSPPFYEPPVPTGITRYEEDHPDLLYNGVPFMQTATSWVMTTAARGSRGYMAYSQTAGDTISLTFEGTWVGVGLLTFTNAGMAEIFIDGESRGVVDTYSRTTNEIALYYDDLAPGSHTLTIVVLGSRNPNSSNDRVFLDYIDVWDGTIMPDGTFEATTAYEENPRLHQSTNWSQFNHASASEGTYIRAGSSVWFPFTGESVTFQAFAYSGAGEVEIYIDGQWQARVDLYNATTITRTFSFGNLGPGPHVLQITNYRGTATVDNFTTPGSPPFYEAPLPTGIIRYEEDHPALLYNGVPIGQTATSWVTSNAVRASRGYVYYSQTANDTVTLDFEG
ncbi:MAG: transglutaminase domain-containing protein, partial [Chloroflexota bacterium]